MSMVCVEKTRAGSIIPASLARKGSRMEIDYTLVGSIAGTLVVSLIACYVWSRLGKGKEHDEAKAIAKRWQTDAQFKDAVTKALTPPPPPPPPKPSPEPL